MRLSAHQPAYLPWLGYFAKVAWSEMFCVFDCVSMDSSSITSFENRNKILGPSGVQWLTVPVRRNREIPLSEVTICNDQPWARKHWRSIEMAYSKAFYFEEYAAGLKSFYMTEWGRLSDLTTEMLRWFMKALGIERPLALASTLGLSGEKSDLVLQMCRHLGASAYLFGAKGRDYANVAAFRAAGVEPLFQDYRHPNYRQNGGGQFTPNLSILDLLFNAGPDSLRVILQGQV